MEEGLRHEQFVIDQFTEPCAYEFHRLMLRFDAEEEEQLYDCLVSGLCKPGKEVPLPNGGTGWKWFIDGPLLEDAQCSRVVEAVMYDHPEMFWVLWHRYWMRPFADHQEYVFLPYTLHPQSIAPLHRRMREWRAWMTERASACSSTIEQVRMICSYLARYVSYRKTKDSTCRTIIGCAYKDQDGNRSAVCEGFTKAFKYLCDGLDIPSLAVRGTWRTDGVVAPPGHHSWNMVDIDGRCYHVDVTLMARGPHGEHGEPFCLRTDAQMLQQGYVWDRQRYPTTDEEEPLMDLLWDMRHLDPRRIEYDW